MEAARVRHLLEERRRSMQRMISLERQTLEAPTRDDDLSSIDQHQADAASELFERERDATILQMALDVVADVEHALGKLDAGRFGSCETCGAPIPDERLAARPEARFCEADERRWELAAISVDLPPTGTDRPEPVDPGWRELDSLLTPDDPEDALLEPEERALHRERPYADLTVADLEEADDRLFDDLGREQRSRATADRRELDEIDEVERLEEGLDR